MQKKSGGRRVTSRTPTTVLQLSCFWEPEKRVPMYSMATRYRWTLGWLWGFMAAPSSSGRQEGEEEPPPSDLGSLEEVGEEWGRRRGLLRLLWAGDGSMLLLFLLDGVGRFQGFSLKKKKLQKNDGIVTIQQQLI